MASAAYNNWVAAVKKNGGRVVIPPTGGGGIPRLPSAAYPDIVWVPKANAREWPIPNEFSLNGKTGYYHAPANLHAEIASFGQATKQETTKAAEQLMDQWGIPAPLRGLNQYFSSLALIGLVLIGVYVTIKRN